MEIEASSSIALRESVPASRLRVVTDLPPRTGADAYAEPEYLARYAEEPLAPGWPRP